MPLKKDRSVQKLRKLRKKRRQSLVDKKSDQKPLADEENEQQEMIATGEEAEKEPNQYECEAKTVPSVEG